MISNISGVIIWTENLPLLTKFYTETMGFTPRSIRQNFINFEWGTMRFSIGSHTSITGQNQDSHRIMINFNVEDIHLVYDALSKRGVTFIRGPEQEHWGGWVSTLMDPDRNIIQLLQQPS